MAARKEAEPAMNKDEDYICFYRNAVIAGHHAPAAETMRRFNRSAAERGHRTMRWSGLYPQLESTNEVAEVARAASAIEDASGLGRLSCRATAWRCGKLTLIRGLHLDHLAFRLPNNIAT